MLSQLKGKQSSLTSAISEKARLRAEDSSLPLPVVHPHFLISAVGSRAQPPGKEAPPAASAAQPRLPNAPSARPGDNAATRRHRPALTAAAGSGPPSLPFSPLPGPLPGSPPAPPGRGGRGTRSRRSRAHPRRPTPHRGEGPAPRRHASLPRPDSALGGGSASHHQRPANGQAARGSPARPASAQAAAAHLTSPPPPARAAPRCPQQPPLHEWQQRRRRRQRHRARKSTAPFRSAGRHLPLLRENAPPAPHRAGASLAPSAH